MLEVSQASAGEAGVAPEAGDVGQGGEVVVQELPCAAPHQDSTVTDAGRVSLEDTQEEQTAHS